MIAPAMNTGPEERLSYRELARQQARLERVISLHRFSRLYDLAGSDTDREAGVVSVFEFYLDEQQWPCVRGSAQTTIELLCHRCAEMVQYPLDAQWDVCIVDESVVDEPTLALLAENRDLLSVDGTSVSAVEIVEDELLLALPERLCRSEPCELMPDLAYPADSGTQASQEDAAPDGVSDEPSPRRKPFAGLAELIADQQREAEHKSSLSVEDSDETDGDPDESGRQR